MIPGRRRACVARTGRGAAAGPASASLPDPSPPRGPRVAPPLLQNAARTWRTAAGPALPSHTAWRPRCPAPLSVLSRLLPPAQYPVGGQRWRARPRVASRGEDGVPAPSGRWGDGAGCCPHQQPPPGRPQHSAWLHLPAPGGVVGCPSPGVAGSCYSVPNPVGHRAIYLDVGRARPPPPPCSPLQETPHFTPPPLSPAPSSPGCGVEETGDLHPPWYQGTVACSPEGLAPARSPDPVGRSSVEAPSTTVWGPGPPFSQLPPFYLCFCLQIGVGSSTGPGQHSPTPVSPGEGFGSSPSAELASTFPHPTKDHTVK